MATRILTPKAPPIFLSRNYLNRGALDNADLTVTQNGGATGSSAFLHRIYDMTRGSYWTSFGSNDTKTELITAGLYQQGAKVQRNIDFVAVLGHNLRNWKFEYKPAAGSWTTLPALDFTSTPDTGENTIASLASPVVANDIRIEANTAEGAGEKQIAEVVVALSSFQPDKAFYRYDRSWLDNVKTVRMADGSLDYTHIYRSDASFEFWQATFGWRAISKAQRDLFRAEKQRREPFIFYPEPGDVPEDIYQVRFEPGSFADNYMAMRKEAGYEIEFTLREVGGG